MMIVMVVVVDEAAPAAPTHPAALPTSCLFSFPASVWMSWCDVACWMTASQAHCSGWTQQTPSPALALAASQHGS